MTDTERTAVESAYVKAAEMEKSFYTRREIANAFLTVAEELHPDT